MTVNNQAAPPSGLGPMPGTIPQRTGSLTRTWMGRSDAVQLSRLGGVLNAFATDASSAFDRVGRLHAAVQDGSYSVNGTALSRRLISEMSGRR
jgi:hypothetical protein